jgi:starch phosphorylase
MAIAEGTGVAPEGAGALAVPGTVAYFSMEVALADVVPTFSGGLGVLAGDHLRSAADLGLGLIGVTLLWRRGYVRQRLETDGTQRDEPVAWSPEDHLDPLSARVSITLGARPVAVGAWRALVDGAGGATVPVYLLDTDLAENTPEDREITGQLYGGGPANRLRQEAVLGLAGPALLEALGHRPAVYHMNEGHSALLTLILRRRVGAAGLDAVQDRCVFTTHTPVPAGHDRFERTLVAEVLGADVDAELAGLGVLEAGALNMTLLGMRASGFVNAVALRHQEVSRRMFPQFAIEAITNGVHGATWVGPSLARLYDRHIPDWRRDNAALRSVIAVPAPEVEQAHGDAKAALVAEVAARTGTSLGPGVFTIGFARRATAYKRADLLFFDLDRLRDLIERAGPLQVIFSGKAHPKDEGGKDLIRRVLAAARALAGSVSVVYLEDYSMGLARLLCAGADVWLNTPVRPQEASGTSGMKAAFNGVPSLSILDGWWLEGCLEGLTGWAIAEDGPASPEDGPETDRADADALYRILGETVLPLFYSEPGRFAELRRSTIALNASWFNTERMVRQYALRAYGPALGRAPGGP